MNGFKEVSLALATAGVLASSMAQAALEDRGGGLIYDNVLDITWLKDANYAATQFVATVGAQGYADGLMNWTAANDWAANLTFHDSERKVDLTGWRLPTALNQDGSGPCAGYNCTKGVHVGVDRLQTFIRRVTANNTRPAWYLQLDIRNCFMSIDKQILFDLLAPRIRDADALWLTRLLVFHDCTRNFVLKGDPKWLGRIPAHKTLFGTGPGKGLPIGNLNSQFFANVYLNALDQFVKHTLKCSHYLRYCDDFVLLAEDREQLVEWRQRIRCFLRERLRLELNDARERLRPVGDGVDFLGYNVRADYLLARRRVVGNVEERLAGFEREMVKEGSLATRYCKRPADPLLPHVSA